MALITLSDFEFGKYDSFDEVLEKDIPYHVKDVIHIQKVDGITVVMPTEPDREKFPFLDNDVLTVAFLRGSDEEGWENIGPNGWTHYENDDLTVYSETVHDHDRQKRARHEVSVVFGEINNPKIAKIETKDEQEESFKAAAVIRHGGKRYYFQIGRGDIVRGLAQDGTVIDQQGG
jgi:dihydroxyacid dehydratase/phosphogluconate dehydratase